MDLCSARWRINWLSAQVNAGGRTILACCMIALALNQNRLASQSWRFVAHEVGVIVTKKEVLQSLSIPKNVACNPLTFRDEEIDEFR
jgi:hypothetical protein